MTYTVATSKLQLGVSISWNFLVPFNYTFFSTTRINIFLNTILFGFLKYFKIRLVKWFGSSQRLYFNLNLVVHYWSHQKKEWSSRLFFFWNKHYFRRRLNIPYFMSLNSKMIAYEVARLPDFYTKKDLKNRFWLGSGPVRHKMLKTIFFFLGRKSLHGVKKHRKRSKTIFGRKLKHYKFIVKSLNKSRNFFKILKKNKLLKFNRRRYVWSFFFQFFFRFYFLFYFWFNRFVTLDKKASFFFSQDFSFFKSLNYILYFCNTQLTKKLFIKKFYSNFSSKALIEKNISSVYFVYGVTKQKYGWKKVSKLYKVLGLKNPVWLNMFYFKKSFYYGNSFKRFFRMSIFGLLQKREEERKDFISGLTKNVFVGYSLIRTFQKKTYFNEYIPRDRKFFLLARLVNNIESNNKKNLNYKWFFFKNKLVKNNFIFFKHLMSLLLFWYLNLLKNFSLLIFTNFFKSFFFFLKTLQGLMIFSFREFYSYGQSLRFFFSQPKKQLLAASENLNKRFFFNRSDVLRLERDLKFKSSLKSENFLFYLSFIFKNFIFKIAYTYFVSFFVFKKLQILLSIFFYKYFIFKFFKKLSLAGSRPTVKFNTFFSKFAIEYSFYYKILNHFINIIFFLKVFLRSFKSFTVVIFKRKNTIRKFNTQFFIFILKFFLQFILCLLLKYLLIFLKFKKIIFLKVFYSVFKKKNIIKIYINFNKFTLQNIFNFNLFSRLQLLRFINKNYIQSLFFYFYWFSYKKVYRFFINFNVIKFVFLRPISLVKVFKSFIFRDLVIKQKNILTCLNTVNLRKTQVLYWKVINFKKLRFVNIRKNLYNNFLIDFSFGKFFNRIFLKKNRKIIFSKKKLIKLKSFKSFFWKKNKLVRRANKLNNLLGHLLVKEHKFTVSSLSYKSLVNSTKWKLKKLIFIFIKRKLSSLRSAKNYLFLLADFFKKSLLIRNRFNFSFSELNTILKLNTKIYFYLNLNKQLDLPTRFIFYNFFFMQYFDFKNFNFFFNKRSTNFFNRLKPAVLIGNNTILKKKLYKVEKLKNFIFYLNKNFIFNLQFKKLFFFFINLIYFKKLKSITNFIKITVNSNKAVHSSSKNLEIKPKLLNTFFFNFFSEDSLLIENNNYFSLNFIQFIFLKIFFFYTPTLFANYFLYSKLIHSLTINFFFLKINLNFINYKNNNFFIYFYIKILKNITNLLFFVQVNCNIYKNKNLLSWLYSKRFFFWFEREVENLIKKNAKVLILNSVRLLSKSLFKKQIFFFFKYFSRYTQFWVGWRQKLIFRDIFWIILVGVKYFSSSYLSTMVSEQIIKRKKHYGFLSKIRYFIRFYLPFAQSKFYVKQSYIILDGLKIVINGKFNGRDRSNRMTIYRYNKSFQITKFFDATRKIDYSFSQANSWYGSFGIHVWISRL